MKKFICLIAFILTLSTAPSLAAPVGHHGGGHGPAMGRPPMHGGVSMGHRPPIHHPPMHMHRPIYRPMPVRPIYRPYYYSSYYYPTTTSYTTYTYYPSTTYTTLEPVTPSVNTVVVRDEYAGINTAANIINTAANVAATIKYLTW